MIERHAGVDPLGQEWDELADRTGAVPWARPGWIGAWLDAFGDSGVPVVLAARREGRLVGVLPLVRRGRALSSPTNWHTPEFGLVAEDAEARTELVRAAIALDPRRLTLAFVRAEGLEELRAEAEDARRRTIVRVVERSPFLPLEGDWESYERTRSKSLRKELRKHRRGLEELGRVELVVEDGRERLDELLEEGFRVEASGWKGEQGTAIRSQPETLRFYTAIARWAAERGTLGLAFLRLDGRAIAFQLLLAEGDAVYLVKPGYDVDLRRFGPGKLLTRELVEWAYYARGAKRLEFLGGEHPAKAEWTDEVHELYLAQVFSRSPAGLADWGAYAGARPLVKRGVALLRR